MKYQMRCPECGHEFAYDNGYYDKNIARLGAEIRAINLQLAEHNMLPWPKRERELTGGTGQNGCWLPSRRSLVN